MRCQDEWPNVPELVQTMFNAQNGDCGYCGNEMILRAGHTKGFIRAHRPRMATFEHLKLASNGGKYELSNGVCVCDRCNGLRANLPLEEFFERYEELLAYLLAKPARDKAKKELNTRKNGYIVAWFAKYTGQTVEDVFLDYTPRNSYDLARNM